MKVLIVEDHIEVLDCIRSYFVDHGHEVATATTAPDGIALLGSFSPDFALIDLRLPKGNGQMIIQDIARRRPDCQTKMIVITADDNLELRRDLKNYGVMEYLFKPITVRELDDLLTVMSPPPVLEVEETPEQKISENDEV